jgi:hypothetical protein
VPHVRLGVHGPKKTGVALKRFCYLSEGTLADVTSSGDEQKALETTFSAHVRWGEGHPSRTLDLGEGLKSAGSLQADIRYPLADFFPRICCQCRGTVATMADRHNFVRALAGKGGRSDPLAAQSPANPLTHGTGQFIVDQSGVREGGANPPLPRNCKRRELEPISWSHWDANSGKAVQDP